MSRQVSSGVGVVHKAVKDDEVQLAIILMGILDDPSIQEDVLRLEGDSAQTFLDVAQHLLDRELLVGKDDLNSEVQILMIKLSEGLHILPSSFFVTGVSGREGYPTFGGGFGDIYRASYNGKPVALKHLRMFHRRTELRSIYSKFCKEALIWQQLKHPYILPMLGIDCETFPSSLCMVSPWMENGTVLKYLEEHGRQDVDRLLWEVAQGLEYLHSRNIVHGCLCGSDILITQDGSPYLSDFDLASFTNLSAAIEDIDRAGKLRWMAPELLDPNRFGIQFRRTKASDVYAFACVCLELYTGRPPFADIREGGVIFKIMQGERPARPTTTPPMSDALWKYVNAWWAEDPATRPPVEVIVNTMSQRSDYPSTIEDSIAPARATTTIQPQYTGASQHLPTRVSGAFGGSDNSVWDIMPAEKASADKGFNEPDLRHGIIQGDESPSDWEKEGFQETESDLRSETYNTLSAYSNSDPPESHGATSPAISTFVIYTPNVRPWPYDGKISKRWRENLLMAA
ncbi:kinase-like domain-containing protein [Mycena rebaudengoi]|nr:kinase-like domain-containing protein [Mycena rebaudengoi]